MLISQKRLSLIAVMKINKNLKHQLSFTSFWKFLKNIQQKISTVNEEKSVKPVKIETQKVFNFQRWSLLGGSE